MLASFAEMNARRFSDDIELHTLFIFTFARPMRAISLGRA